MKPARWIFSDHVLHEIRLHGNVYPEHNARWHRVQELVAGLNLPSPFYYQLHGDLLAHADGYVRYAPASARFVPFRGWLLPANWFACTEEPST